MKLPNLTEIPVERETLSVFAGYNHRLRIADGEFYDVLNLTSDHYPLLSPRGRRGKYKSKPDTTSNRSGLLSKDVICYAEGNKLVYGDNSIDMELNDDPKRIVSMGAYAIVFPDMKFLNLKTAENGRCDGDSFEARLVESVSGNPSLTYTLCDVNGEAVKWVTDDPRVPQSPTDGDLYLDCYEKKIMVYSGEEWKLASDPRPCFKFGYKALTGQLNIGDHIKISSLGVSNVEEECDCSVFNGNSTVVNKTDNKLVCVLDVDKISEGTRTYYVSDKAAVIQRLAPVFDEHIIESHNRIWSCRYGKNINGEFVNEIFASKLGSFKEWYCLEGTSQDSYYASVGSDGMFTGAIEYGGTPIFFKERCMHRIYGDYPATFQINTVACEGVQSGCGRSLAIVNSVLYYKSTNGIYAYDGSIPVCVSEPLGDLSGYGNAVACAIGSKYYISMQKGDKSVLFVLDTIKRLWHKEDSPRIVEIVSHGGDGYALTENGEIITLLGSVGTPLPFSPWYAETGIIGVDDPDTKYISRIDIRMSLTVGTRVSISIQYDSSGEWEHIYTATGTTLRSFTAPICARKCDHFRLRIDGDGDAKIFSICKNTVTGKEV